jgi:hypothetical protein
VAYYPLSGGAGRTLGWRLPESPYLETLGVGIDGRVLFAREGSVPARLERIDLETGQRVAWKTLSPPDSTGVAHIWTVLVTPDGKGYAYTYGQFLQDLFLVEGLS